MTRFLNNHVSVWTSVFIVLLLSNVAVMRLSGQIFYGTSPARSSIRQIPLRASPLTIPTKYTSFYRSVSDSVRLPEGFRMNVFHAGMKKPRFFAWNPRGILHVVDMTTENVVALPDRNNDGIADTSYIAASGVKQTHSLIFVNDTMLVAEPSRILRFLDRDNDGVYESRSIFLDSIPDGGPFNHYTRTLVYDSTQKAYFLSVGTPCDACRVPNPERSAILRFNADGSGRRVFASGLRNAIGLAVEPATGLLWTTNADRNGQGEEKPEEIISTVPDGSFHGWPLAFSISQGQEASGGAVQTVWSNFQANDEYRAMLPLTRADSVRVAGMKRAEALLPAHSTPMGIAFYTGANLPPIYRNAAFIAVHGSYGPSSRKKAVGYSVVMMRRDAASGGFFLHDFLTGFLTDSAAYKFWGRPCGVGFSPDGDMFVSSDWDIAGIYRISFDKNALSSTTTGIGQENDFPSAMFPQPATSNDAVWLDVVVPQNAVAQCSIFDIRGAEILTFSENLKRGKNALHITEHLKRRGVTLQNGTYFYRMSMLQNGIPIVSRGKFSVMQ